MQVLIETGDVEWAPGVYVDTLARRVAEVWYSMQAPNPYMALHLWHRPSEGATAGKLAVATESPEGEGWVLSDNRRMSPMWNMDRAYYFVRDVLPRLPLLAAEEMQE